MRSALSNGRKPRIAWFSPLPGGSTPVGSKASYTSACLLPFICESFEVELFHNEFRRYQNYPTHHYLSAFERHQQQPFDLFLYQVEDLPCANFVRAHLGLIPGVVWFHDLLFTTRCPDGLLHSPWEVTLQKFLGKDVAWPTEELWPDVSSPVDRRAASLALLPIFSNPWAHSEYLRSIEQSFAETTNIRPHSYYLPIPAEPTKSFVQNTGEFTVGFAGTARIEARSHVLLQALSEVQSPVKLLWLLDESERGPAQALCKEFSVNSVEFVTKRSPERWQELLPRINLAIHTLFSVFGSTAPYLSLSLLAKLPAVTTRFGATELLPPGATTSIEPGDSEVTQLRTVIEKQLRESSPNEIGYGYGCETFLTRDIAAELTTLLFRAQQPLSQALNRWTALESEARGALLRSIQGARAAHTTPPSDTDLLGKSFSELGWLAAQ